MNPTEKPKNTPAHRFLDFLDTKAKDSHISTLLPLGKNYTLAIRPNNVSIATVTMLWKQNPETGRYEPVTQTQIVMDDDLNEGYEKPIKYANQMLKLCSLLIAFLCEDFTMTEAELKELAAYLLQNPKNE